MPEDEVIAGTLSWQVLVRMRAETAPWDREAFRERLQELASTLSKVMFAEVSVLALVGDSPLVISSSPGKLEFPRKNSP